MQGWDGCLSELGQRLGMPALRPDAAGCCQLLFDGRWLVTLALAPGGQHLWLHCPLTCAGPDLPADALALLLQGNFMGTGCGGGAFAIGPDGRVYLQQQIERQGAGELHNRIEALLNMAETWAQRLSTPSQAAPGRPAQPAGREWVLRV